MWISESGTGQAVAVMRQNEGKERAGALTLPPETPSENGPAGTATAAVMAVDGIVSAVRFSHGAALVARPDIANKNGKHVPIRHMVRSILS